MRSGRRFLGPSSHVIEGREEEVWQCSNSGTQGGGGRGSYRQSRLGETRGSGQRWSNSGARWPSSSERHGSRWQLSSSTYGLGGRGGGIEWESGRGGWGE
ncbi:hypothetical protein E2562_035507 [Oryza meyeriana var. granulata]|uniref:Uncharacterized protein n=1 Tax=Oryza meyeriana var. granulata TaxID=110450 RepID=A0A6G1DAA4_9ORYZ|nr:hypothetical protein E2562_035507 [Oryza meyeriana var. granulata]